MIRFSRRNSRRNRKISEGYQSNKRLNYCQEYSGILAGLDILNIDGDDRVCDLVDDEEWWEMSLEANPRIARKLSLDSQYNRPGDEEYDPEHPLVSPTELEGMKYEMACEDLETDIDDVDYEIMHDDMSGIVRKHLGQDRRISDAGIEDWFSLHKVYGDTRGNKVEWIFDEEVLEEEAKENIADILCNGDKESAVQKIRDCCAEINQHIRDRSSAELDKYVAY